MKTKLMISVMVATLLLTALPLPAFAAAKPAGATTAPTATVTCTYDGLNELIAVALKNVPKGTHVVETRVLSPDFGRYQTFTQSFTLTRAGSYSITHTLPIAGTWAETMPGTWNVKVLLDGVERGAGSFEVI